MKGGKKKKEINTPIKNIFVKLLRKVGKQKEKKK
jgi:hypothetical protein